MALLADTGWPTLLFLAALATATAILLLRTQRYYGRPSRAPPSFEHHARSHRAASGRHATPEHHPPQSHPDGPQEMMKWEVEMHDLARELSARLDSKMSALEHLTREADRAAARLETALAATRRRDVPSPAPAAPRQDAPQPPAAAAETILPPKSQADALKPGGLDDRGLRLDETGEESASERPSRDRRYEEIYTLADYGYAAAEIAQRLGTPVGEIELILSLRH